MTPRQLLRQVELPLALPSIVAGIRVAAVIGVGTATIAAAVGAGGLGEYIFRGLSMVDPTVILAGAIPAALLALTRRRRAAAGSSARWRRRAHASRAGAAGMRAVGWRPPRSAWRSRVSRSGATSVIRVGSKNFTEQIILGELVAQPIEARPALHGRAPAESRRHVHLRSGAAQSARHRRLRRVHRHGADRGLPAAGRDRSAAACSSASRQRYADAA